jgi:hypothetical protein
MITKNVLLNIIRFCGGEGHYSGRTKTMYIHHLKDRWTYNVLTAYLFKKINVVFEEEKTIE